MPATNVVYGEGWGQALEDLKLPSGALCQIRKLQMEDLIEMGILDQIDSLSEIVQTKHVDRVKQPSDRKTKAPTKAQLTAIAEVAERENTASILKDPARFGAMASIIDKAVVSCVVKPSVVSAYNEVEGVRLKIPQDLRVEGVVYTDSIPFNDKMTVFETVFSGVKNLESFREGSEETVGDVDSK